MLHAYFKNLNSFFFYKILNVYFLHRGNKPETRGTAFVVYEDIFDAKNAAEHLSGFNVMGR
jgi:pre-mRNA branch site protein p14